MPSSSLPTAMLERTGFPGSDRSTARELTDTERDRIKRRAHALWREAGYPKGRDRELWEQAELQILKGYRNFRG